MSYKYRIKVIDYHHIPQFLNPETDEYENVVLSTPHIRSGLYMTESDARAIIEQHKRETPRYIYLD